MIRENIPTYEQVTERYNFRKIPFVAFKATVSNGNDNWDEPMVLDVSTLNNSRPDVIDHYRKKGWPVIGYGNLTAKPEHRELEEHLVKLTELGQEKKHAAMKAKIEAEVRTELEDRKSVV